MKMDFKTALKTVYETRKSDDELYNPFLIYSRAADLIGDSYEEKKKLSLFFTVEKRINLLAILSDSTEDNADDVREGYFEISDLMSEKSFNRLVDMLMEVVGLVTPEMDEKLYKAKSAEDCSQSHVDADNAENKKSPVLSETKDDAPSEDQNTVESVSGKTYAYGRRASSFSMIRALLFLLSVAALVTCGVLHVRWEIYQWIVGAASLVILLMVRSVAAAVMRGIFIDDEIPFTIMLGVEVVANFILFFMFRDAYNIICYWASAALLISGVIAAAISFDDFMPVCGWINVIEIILTIAIILLNIFL